MRNNNDMMVGSLRRLLSVQRGGNDNDASSDVPPLEQLESSNNQKQRSTVPSTSFYPIKSFAGVLAMIVVVLRTNILFAVHSANNYKIMSTTLKRDSHGPKTGDDSPSLRSVWHSVDRRFPRTVAISSQSMSERTVLTDVPYTKNFQIDIDSVSSTDSILITPEWYEPNSLELMRGYNLDVCEPNHDWQSRSFPNCNILHEADLSEMKLINHGTIRLVFEMSENIDGNVKKVVFKTLMMEDSPLTSTWVDRERKDALVLDRATGSRFIPNIYGYCSHAEFMAHAPHDLYS